MFEKEEERCGVRRLGGSALTLTKDVSEYNVTEAICHATDDSIRVTSDP